ncbi:MAG: hypothetical protein IPH11_15520 [Ignavibacteriales bacterium]|nr:hypothetical protein [Ignavibacteriales bacterium]
MTTKKITKKISELYKHYILFVNKIYFREITAQEQGIEIYDMMQKIMRIPSDVKDLDNEMEELNHFASMTAEKNKNEEAIKLTKVATIFLIPTLMASLLGMNVLPDFVNIPTILLSTKPVWPFWISLIIIFIITYVTIKFNLIRFILNWFPKQNKNKKK